MRFQRHIREKKVNFENTHNKRMKLVENAKKKYDLF